MILRCFGRVSRFVCHVTKNSRLSQNLHTHRSFLVHKSRLDTWSLRVSVKSKRSSCALTPKFISSDLLDTISITQHNSSRIQVCACMHAVGRSLGRPRPLSRSLTRTVVWFHIVVLPVSVVPSPTLARAVLNMSKHCCYLQDNLIS
jgi:hypothetical protein